MQHVVNAYQPFQRDSRDMSTHFFVLKYVFHNFSRKIILFTIHLLGRLLKQKQKITETVLGSRK